jgi:hypothetical protein
MISDAEMFFSNDTFFSIQYRYFDPERIPLLIIVDYDQCRIDYIVEDIHKNVGVAMSEPQSDRHVTFLVWSSKSAPRKNLLYMDREEQIINENPKH